MLMKIARYVLITSLCVSSTNWAKNIDPHKLLKKISKDIDCGRLTREKEEQYAKQLRLIIAQSYMSHIDPTAIKAPQDKLLKHIRRQFSSIVNNWPIAGKKCEIGLVGHGLLLRKHPKALDTLIREAKAFSIAAHVMLMVLYEGTIDGFKYDSRISAFFKETALEGFSQSQLYYGRSLLYGLGIGQNISEGLKYLELAAQARIADAYLELAYYYDDKKDMVKVEQYLTYGVELGSTKAMLKLAVLEIDRKNYDKAFSLCNKALELNPEHYGVKLLLGWMYEGHGVTQDGVKAFHLTEEVAKKVDERFYQRLKALAYWNLAVFYQDGTGTVQSSAKAEEYFKKAEELGYEKPRDS